MRTDLFDSSAPRKTVEVAGVPVRVVGEKVLSLQERRNEVIAALDFLFTGF